MIPILILRLFKRIYCSSYTHIRNYIAFIHFLFLLFLLKFFFPLKHVTVIQKTFKNNKVKALKKVTSFKT